MHCGSSCLHPVVWGSVLERNQNDLWSGFAASSVEDSVIQIEIGCEIVTCWGSLQLQQVEQPQLSLESLSPWRDFWSDSYSCWVTCFCSYPSHCHQLLSPSVLYPSNLLCSSQQHCQISYLCHCWRSLCGPPSLPWNETAA